LGPAIRDLPPTAPSAKTGGRTTMADVSSVEHVEHVERIVIPAMWSPRFRLVVQPQKANP
jgi:hypothetical protein